MLEASASYQDMLGEIWSVNGQAFIEDNNQTFLASVRLKKAISMISSAGLTPKIEGSGAVISQNPDPGTILYKKAVCMLKLK